MRYLRYFCCAMTIAMLHGCGSDAPPEQPTTAAPTQAAQPKPAPVDSTEKMARAVGNGKPGAAADIKYEFAAKPDVGKAVELQVALIPSAGVDSLEATFSGMDGITLAGPLTVSIASPKAGEPHKHTLSVLADRNGVFYITVAVSTQISGVTLGRTFAIPFVAGAQQVQQKPAPATDASGQAVQPMKGEETR
ncbi:MAG TPA: hypothetical protein VIU34_30635 [Steroidobacter sp.]